MVNSIWRNDGVIEYIVTPSVATATFVALAAQHSTFLCYLMEDMAATLTSGDMDPELSEKYHIDLDILREGMRKQHKSADHTSRMSRGAPDYLDGMFYGSMHPAELYVLSDDLATLLSVFAISGQSETGKQLIESWSVWIEAAKKFVRPAEAIGSAWMGSERNVV